MADEASPIRPRLGIGLLYAAAIAANGVLVWYMVRDHPQVVRLRERLRSCTGCQRRRAMVERVWHEATSIVTEAAPAETTDDQ